MSASQAPVKLSLSLGSKKPDVTRKAKLLNGTKRPHSALHESDDEEAATAEHESISHFDKSAGGAIDANKTAYEKKPLVIPALPNRDRMEEGRRKKQKSGIPAGANPADETVIDSKKEMSFGLQVPEKKTIPSEDAEPIVQGATNGHAATPPKEKTEDEMALDALLGNKSANIRTIPTISEEEAYQRDIEQAPEAPTLDQYMAVPVDEFGAALLRGMGWKDTETLAGGQDQPAMKPRTFERRPALLGVGAKPASAVGVEIGEWGKASRGKNSKQESYNPVVLRNKVTGETLTEEELKVKLEEQKNKEMDLVIEENERLRISDAPSRKKYYEDEQRDSDRSRRREAGDDRKRSHRRDRSASVDSRRARKDTSGRGKERSCRDDRSPDEGSRRRKDYEYRKESGGRRRERSTSADVKSRKYDDSRREKERSSKDKSRSRYDDDRYDRERSKKDRYDRDHEGYSDRRRR